MTKSLTFEDSKLYKALFSIAERIYGLLDDFQEEEKWAMGASARTNAFYITSYFVEGYGSMDPRDQVWYYGKVRRSLFSLQNLLKLAGKVGILEVDPQIMVDLQQCLKQLDQEIATATKAIPAWFDQWEPQEKREQPK